MRSASLAEWIIARFTARARAASIIGDLLEAVPEKGKLWFWLSVAGVFFSLTWRHALALAFAFYLFKYRPYASAHVEVLGPAPVHVPVYSPTLKMQLYMYLFSIGFFLRLGAPYMAIRYGLKDLFVRQTLAAWVLVTVLSRYGYKSPQIEIACIALAGCGMVYSAVSAQRRKGLLALVCVIVFLFTWDKFNGPVVLIVFRAILLVAPSQILLAALLMVLLIQAFAFATAHRLFFEKSSRSPENELRENRPTPPPTMGL